ncbi:uncharacterized protein LOC113211474 isoform X2 [Frankliniella occidentalis]|uniref:Uncharacterized protein LOC113211474 isoform X2 n=1 Tax=Frankliniella occidentalis TaxID=133901 RepID=A0A9C6X362_FRAOC|nr:uncharacterized protein LOC113211474 isoform X2 [Frankliniella occidentalis]
MGQWAITSRLSGSRSRSGAFILVTALLCQKSIHGKALNTVYGPYTAYTERFYNCERDNLPDQWHLRTTHFNPLKPREVQLLTGNLTVEEPIDDSCCGLKVILDTRSNNQWKENAFIFAYKSNVCRTIKENMPGFYNLFFKKEVNGACVKPGVYQVNNAPIEWIFPNVPIMPYGQYRFRLMVHKPDHLIACIVVECRLVPKH